MDEIQASGVVEMSSNLVPASSRAFVFSPHLSVYKEDGSESCQVLTEMLGKPTAMWGFSVPEKLDNRAITFSVSSLSARRQQQRHASIGTHISLLSG